MALYNVYYIKMYYPYHTFITAHGLITSARNAIPMSLAHDDFTTYTCTSVFTNPLTNSVGVVSGFTIEAVTIEAVMVLR